MHIRISPSPIIALAIAVLALVPSAGLAHNGAGATRHESRTPSIEQRIEALALNVKIESLRTNAPRAVHGECEATVDVPGQGDSCKLPGGMWGVVRSDGTTASSHGPDVYADSVPKIALDPATQVATLTAAGDLAANPLDSDFVSCTTDRRVPHTTIVFAKPHRNDIWDGQPISIQEAADTVEHLRSAIRQASAFIEMQAADGGQTGTSKVRLRVLCTAGGMIDVTTVQMPELGLDPDFSDVESTVKSFPSVVSADDAGRVAAYYPIDEGGAAGQGWVFDDYRQIRNNYNNDADTFAAHYIANDSDDPHATNDPADVDPDTHLQTGGVRWDVILHEMMHNMGAVYSGAYPDVPPPADSNGWGHCKSDADIMCYDEHGINTHDEAACAFVQLDCNHDTYFDARSVVPGGSWLLNHWNSGAPLNRYLDFGVRNNADIMAPTRPTNVIATSTSPNQLAASWNASSDDQSTVTYTVCMGTNTPSKCSLAPIVATTVNFASGVPAGAIQVWVTAFDTSKNASVASAPVTVNVASPVIVSPPSGGTSGTTGTSGTKGSTTSGGRATLNHTPVAPSSIDTTALGIGKATLAWSVEGAPAETQYRVEVNREDIGEWSFATALSAAGGATVAIPPGIATKVRIYAQTTGGSTRSDFILMSSPTRGSKCTYATGDAAPPAAPRRPKMSARSTKTIKVAFGASTDPHGVCAIRAFTRANAKGAWRRTSILPGTSRSVTFAGLKAHTRYQLAVEAIDANGNVRRSILTTATK